MLFAVVKRSRHRRVLKPQRVWKKKKGNQGSHLALALSERMRKRQRIEQKKKKLIHKLRFFVLFYYFTYYRYRLDLH